MSTFESAGPAEILRASQKDQYYIAQLKNNTADLFQTWAGARAWIQWRSELDLLTDCLYFGLTTLSGFQTLGEEYVNIIQANHTKREVPSALRRAFLVFCYAGVPYLFEKCLAKLSYRLEADLPVPSFLEDYREKLQEYIPVIKHLSMLLHRGHMALFYLTSVFYHISKRFSGIQYLMVRRGISHRSLKSSFRLLGALSIAQLVLSIVWQLYEWSKSRAETSSRKRVNTISESDSTSTDSRWRCSLCLEKRQQSTATPCGHLFCWHCIMEWCATKPECPLCREPIQPSRLIFLQNYGPS